MEAVRGIESPGRRKVVVVVMTRDGTSYDESSGGKSALTEELRWSLDG